MRTIASSTAAPLVGAGQALRLHVRVTPKGQGTQVEARVWPGAEPEPQAWQVSGVGGT